MKWSALGRDICLLIAACAIVACHPREQPQGAAPSHRKATMARPMPSSMTDTPIAGIFPPQWRVGQAWRVVCKTQVPKPDMPRPHRTFGDVFFRFRVAEVPDDEHSLYRLDAVREDEVMETNYQIYYRPEPFRSITTRAEIELARRATTRTGPSSRSFDIFPTV